MGFALGDLRLTSKAFWRLTWREYLILAAGFHRRQIRQWQHTRFIVAGFFNANRGQDDDPVQPTDVLWLPGDAEAPPPPAASLTEAEYLAELDRLDAIADAFTPAA